MVLVVGNLLRDLLPLIIFQRLPISRVLGFMVIAIPFTLPYIVPWSLLVGVQLTFGRLSADNELTVVSSSGVSMPRFCIPVFLIAIALSLLCLWINCVWAPQAKIRMSDSIVNLALENPGQLFQNNLSADLFSNRQVFVDSVDGNLLENIQIFEVSKEGDLVRVISAKQAAITRAKEAGAFLLKFKNTRIEERIPSDPGQPMKIRQGMYLKEGTYVLPVGKATGADHQKNALSAQSMSLLQEEAGDPSNPRQSAAMLEIHRRLSLAMACMTFVLVGIPLAVTARRRETSAGFAFSLIIAFYFYFFIIVAQAFSSSPLISIPLVWTPNVVFVIGGLVLFQRLSKR
jgi:lipopolysaccharide export system permease protein